MEKENSTFIVQRSSLHLHNGLLSSSLAGRFSVSEEQGAECCLDGVIDTLLGLRNGYHVNSFGGHSSKPKSSERRAQFRGQLRKMPQGGATRSITFLLHRKMIQSFVFISKNNLPTAPALVLNDSSNTPRKHESDSKMRKKKYMIA